MDVRILISAVDNASKVLDSVAGKAAVIGLGMERTGQSLATVGRGMQSVADPIKGAIQTAMGLESVMADVNKVLGAEEVAAAGVGKGLMEMSRRIPTSVEGLAAISAAGGSLGLTAKEVLGFTEVAAKMGIAFDMSADRAGVAIAKLRNVFSLDTKGGVKEVQALGDTINALENDMSLNAADAVEAMTRIGGTTRTFGLSADQAAALAASIIALGNAPDVAATAINSILPSLQTATGGTKAFKEGLLMTGISAEQMSEMVKKDGMGAINALLQSLQKLDPQGRALAIKKMFGSGADARALGTLANDAGQLTKALGIINDQTKKAGSMEREFASRSNTTANSMQLLQNNLAEIAITVGSVLLPALNTVVKAIMPIVQGVASFAEANPLLAKIAASALIIVAGFGAIIVALGTTISFVGSAIAGFGTLAGVWAATAAGMVSAAGWVASVGGLGAILGSVGTVISIAFGAAVASVGALGAPFIAVAAVAIGAAFLIVRNWKPISAFFVNLFTNPIGTLKNTIKSVGSLFSSLAARVLPFLSELARGANAIFGGIAQAIASSFTWAFRQVVGVWRGIGNALAPVGNAIKSVVLGWINITTALPRFLFGFVVGLFQGLAPAIASSLSVLSGVVGAVLTPVRLAMNGVAAILAIVAVSIGQKISEIVAQVISVIGVATTVVRSAVNQVGAVFLGFVARIAKVFAVIGTVIQSIFAGVITTIAGVLQAAQGLVSGFVGAVLTSLSGITTRVIAVMSSIAGAVGGFITQIVSKVQSILTAFSTAQASGQSMGAAIGTALGQVITVIGGIIAKVTQIPQAFLGIGSQILASINAITNQMFAAGANIIGQLIGGIRSKIGEATSAMSNAVGQMRAYLPFSPAKVGPLRDLDQVNFMGTLAQSITPAPMLAALQGVTGAIAGAMGGLLGALPAPLQGIAGALGITPTTPGQEAGGGTTIPVAGGTTDGGMGITAPAGGGGAITLNYSPTITIQSGATPAAEDNFRQQLAQHRDEIARILADINRQQKRVSYG